MKAMLTGFAAIVVIAVGAHFALEELDYASDEVFTSPNVRLD